MGDSKISASVRDSGLLVEFDEFGSSSKGRKSSDSVEENSANLSQLFFQGLQALMPKSDSAMVSKLFLDPKEVILPSLQNSFLSSYLSRSEQAWARIEAGESMPMVDASYLTAPDVLKTKFVTQPSPFEKLAQAIRSRGTLLQEDLSLAQLMDYAFLHHDKFGKELVQAFGELPFQSDGTLKPDVVQALEQDFAHYSAKAQDKSELLQKSLLEQVLDPKASLKNRAMAYFAYQGLTFQTTALQLQAHGLEKRKTLPLHVQAAQAYEKLYALSAKSDHAQFAALAYYQAGSLAASSNALEVLGKSKEFFLLGVRLLQNLPDKFHRNGQILEIIGDGLSEAGYDAEAIQIYDRAYSSAIVTQGTRVEVASHYQRFKKNLESKVRVCLIQDKTRDALKDIHKQAQTLRSKQKESGRLTTAEKKQLGQLEEALSLARQVSSITFPGKTEGTEPVVLTKIRDQVLSQLKGELSEQTLQTVKDILKRLAASTTILHQAHAARFEFLSQEYPDYATHHILNTGDWSLLRLNYEGANDLPKHWNPEHLNSKGFVKLQETSPEQAEQVSEIIQIFQRPHLLPQGIEGLDSLEQAVAVIQRKVLQPQSALAALTQSSQEVQFKENPGFWFSETISTSHTNLQEFEKLLQGLQQVKQDNGVEEAKVKDFIRARVQEFKTQIAEYREHTKRLGLLGIDKAVPFATELAKALEQIKKIEQDLDTQDLPTSLKKLQHSEAVLYQAALFTQGAVLKGWQPGKYVYFAKLDKTEWVSSGHWEQAMDEFKQTMALTDTGPINIAQVLKAGEKFQRSIDPSAFKPPEERLEELLTTHLTQWYGVCDEMKKHSEDTLAIEQLIGLFENAKTALKKGDFAAARAIYQKATESRLYQKVGEQFEDFRSSVMKQELALEVCVIAAAGLISGGVAWTVAPTLMAATSTGTALTWGAVGGLALEASLFVAAEKGIRGGLHYGLSVGPNPFQNAQGQWLNSGDYAFEAFKMMGLLGTVKKVIRGVNAFTAGRSALKNPTVANLLDDALEVGGKNRNWLLQKFTEQQLGKLKGFFKKAGHKTLLFGAEFAGLQAWNNVGASLEVLYQNLRYGQDLHLGETIQQVNSFESMAHGGAVLLGLKLSGIATGPLHQKAMGKRGKQAVHDINLSEFNKLISQLEGKLNQPGVVFDAGVQAKLNKLTELGDQIHGVGQVVPAYLQDSQQQWLTARQFLAQGLKLEVRGKKVNHSLPIAKEQLPKPREEGNELGELFIDGIQWFMRQYGPKPSIASLAMMAYWGFPVPRMDRSGSRPRKVTVNGRPVRRSRLFQSKDVQRAVQALENSIGKLKAAQEGENYGYQVDQIIAQAIFSGLKTKDILRTLSAVQNIFATAFRFSFSNTPQQITDLIVTTIERSNSKESVRTLYNLGGVLRRIREPQHLQALLSFVGVSKYQLGPMLRAFPQVIEKLVGEGWNVEKIILFFADRVNKQGERAALQAMREVYEDPKDTRHSFLLGAVALGKGTAFAGEILASMDPTSLGMLLLGGGLLLGSVFGLRKHHSTTRKPQLPRSITDALESHDLQALAEVVYKFVDPAVRKGDLSSLDPLLKGHPALRWMTYRTLEGSMKSRDEITRFLRRQWMSYESNLTHHERRVSDNFKKQHAQEIRDLMKRYLPVEVRISDLMGRKYERVILNAYEQFRNSEEVQELPDPMVEKLVVTLLKPYGKAPNARSIYPEIQILFVSLENVLRNGVLQKLGERTWNSEERVEILIKALRHFEGNSELVSRMLGQAVDDLEYHFPISRNSTDVDPLARFHDRLFYDAVMASKEKTGEVIGLVSAAEEFLKGQLWGHERIRRFLLGLIESNESSAIHVMKELLEHENTSDLRERSIVSEIKELQRTWHPKEKQWTVEEQELFLSRYGSLPSQYLSQARRALAKILGRPRSPNEAFEELLIELSATTSDSAGPNSQFSKTLNSLPIAPAGAFKALAASLSSALASVGLEVSPETIGVVGLVLGLGAVAAVVTPGKGKPASKTASGENGKLHISEGIAKRIYEKLLRQFGKDLVSAVSDSRLRELILEEGEVLRDRLEVLIENPVQDPHGTAPLELAILIEKLFASSQRAKSDRVIAEAHGRTQNRVKIRRERVELELTHQVAIRLKLEKNGGTFWVKTLSGQLKTFEDRRVDSLGLPEFLTIRLRKMGVDLLSELVQLDEGAMYKGSENGWNKKLFSENTLGIVKAILEPLGLSLRMKLAENPNLPLKQAGKTVDSKSSNPPAPKGNVLALGNGIQARLIGLEGTNALYLAYVTDLLMNAINKGFFDPKQSKPAEIQEFQASLAEIAREHRVKIEWENSTGEQKPPDFLRQKPQSINFQDGPIEDLELNHFIAAILHRQGVHWISKLLSYTYGDLFRLFGGIKNEQAGDYVKAVQEALERKDLAIGMALETLSPKVMTISPTVTVKLTLLAKGEDPDLNLVEKMIQQEITEEGGEGGILTRPNEYPRDFVQAVRQGIANRALQHHIRLEWVEK